MFQKYYILIIIHKQDFFGLHFSGVCWNIIKMVDNCFNVLLT